MSDAKSRLELDGNLPVGLGGFFGCEFDGSLNGEFADDDGVDFGIATDSFLLLNLIHSWLVWKSE